VFDPESGKVLEQGLFKQDWTFNLQLSAMDWSTEGMGNPTLHHVDYQGCRPGFDLGPGGGAVRGSHRPRPAARGDAGRAVLVRAGQHG
jgi:hypothetical protein